MTEGLRLTEEQKLELESIYPYLRKLARRVAGNLGYGWDSHLIEDMASEAVLQASRLFKTYDPDRGCKFSTYVTEFMWWYLFNYAERIIRRRGKHLSEVISDSLQISDENPFDEHILNRLPILKSDDYAIVRRFFGIGCTQEPHQAIGRSLGMATKTVQRRISMLLMGLHKHICASGLEI